MSQPMKPKGQTKKGETAAKLRQRFDWLESFSDEELGELSFLSPDDRTKPNEEYFDISEPEKGVLGGSQLKKVPEESRFIAKSDVPMEVWEKMTRPFR